MSQPLQTVPLLMDPPKLNWDPPRLSRAATVPEAEWEKHRLWISDLHRSGSTLDEIMSVMRYHSAQEGTFFEPTRKQYVSRLKKWDLRRYGLRQYTKEESSVLARRYSESGGEDNGFLVALQYHQLKCRWCEPASPTCPAIQHNVRLAFKHGPLSQEEVRRKLDLADFHLAAKDPEDAWTLFAEALYRSHTFSYLDRLRIAVKFLCSLIHFGQKKAAKDHLVYVLLSYEAGPELASEPLWMMHFLRGTICQTRGHLDLSIKHIHKAAELCGKAGNIPGHSPIFYPPRELIAEIHGRLCLQKAATTHLSPEWYSLIEFRMALFPMDSMQKLLQWCLTQVEGDGYSAMLDSSIERPWTKAPSLQTFKEFESTSLFCYLWQKYTDALKAQSRGGWSIVEVVEKFEQSMQIPAPMILSTVSSMRSVIDTTSLVTDYTDFSLEQIARQASVYLKRLEMLYFWTKNPGLRDYNEVCFFFKAYDSLSYALETTDEQRHFRKVSQSFVRQFAQVRLPQSGFAPPLEGPEAYAWRTSSLTGIARLVDGEKVETNGKGPRQGDPVISTIEPTTTEPTTLTVQPVISALPPPNLTARSISSTVPEIREANERPASSASVDMLATPRSSVTSSKASLRSFQRFGRGVTERLLTRGGSGSDQLPSEVIDRDSHSSWSLRRLTGVSYLSTTSHVTVDGEPEEDKIMEEAPFQN